MGGWKNGDDDSGGVGDGRGMEGRLACGRRLRRKGKEMEDVVKTVRGCWEGGTGKVVENRIGCRLSELLLFLT